MKNKITVESLKARVQEYIVIENDPMEDPADWAYVALEPDLLACEEVTLNYLMQIEKEEFFVLGENQWFETILSKFKSVEMLNVILSQYANFYGEDTETDMYQDSIKYLHKCII